MKKKDEMQGKKDKQPAAASSAASGTFSWSRDDPLPIPWMLGAALGMGVPLAAGAALGRAELGMPAALGGLALTGIPNSGTLTDRGRQLVYALAAGTFAVSAGIIAAGHGWLTGAAIVLLAVAAALAGNLGKRVAMGSSTFVIFLIIGSNLGITGPAAAAANAVLFLCGSLLTLFVVLASSALLRDGTCAAVHGPGSTVVRPPPTAQQRLGRWYVSLRTAEGWQFAFRLGLCLAAGETIILYWGQAEAYWIAIVIAIVIQRSHEQTIARLVQRGAGTCIGVLLGSILLLWSPPAGILVLAVMALAASRPYLRVRNYAVYSAAMTPLVLILLSFGQQVTPELVAYRLLDTVIGLGIAYIFGYLIRPPEKPDMVRAGADR